MTARATPAPASQRHDAPLDPRRPATWLPSDPLLRNAWLGLIGTALMAGAGAAFWVLVARLRPEEEVGLAGTLVTAGEALGVLAMLGYNVAIVRTMPTSDRQRADVLTATAKVAGAATLLAVAYVAVLPLVAPSLADVVVGWWAAPLFVVWVAATSVNQLSDSLFLAIDRLATNVRVNGLLMSAVKLGLPFLLGGFGAIGIYGSIGTAAAVAGGLSIVLVLRALPRGPRWGASRSLDQARRFGRAGYVSETLYLAPQLVFPLLVVAVLGAAQNALYFVAFQVVTLLNALVYVVAHSMYAEASRRPHEVRAVVAQGGRTVLAGSTAGVVALLVAAPWLLAIFGPTYSEGSTTTLRVLALGTFAVGLNYWAAMRLRIAGHLPAMVVVQALTSAVMVAAAVLLAPLGIVWVAVAWGGGHLFGGLLGLTVSMRVAPLRDHAPTSTEAP